jgi:NhaA family Na+:H+ antiporter
MKLFTRNFLANEAAGGVMMLIAAMLAMGAANSALAPYYTQFITLPLPGGLNLSHLIQDVFMAVFFLFVGLELKNEMLVGSLAARGQKALPLLAAAGGIMVPALIYLFITRNQPELSQGWAIPTATDIAFAVCILRLIGPSIPQSAKMFLLAIAIYDDLAAILIIAFFYSASIALVPLGAAAAIAAALYALNRFTVVNLIPYLLLGAWLWLALSQAGIHPTIAGVVTAIAIPLRGTAGKGPLTRLLHGLHPYVTFGILPLFAFVSAGVNLSFITPAALFETLPLAIILGLFFGKQIGIFFATWASVRLGFAPLPAGVSWRMVYGMAIVAGIGFTMSFFIGQLAFTDDTLQAEVKIGVLAGSLISAIVSFAVLRTQSARSQAIS